MSKKMVSVTLIVVFLAVLMIPDLTMNREPWKISQAENRYLARFPEIFDSSGKLNPEVKSQLKSWFDDNLGFRDGFLRISSAIQYHVFHQSPTDKVSIGDDGWFYYTLDDNLKIASGQYPKLDEEVLAEIVQQQRVIQQKLASRGIDYVLILPTSKVSIYPEYIREGEYAVTRTPVDMLADYLQEYTDIKVVRLKEAMLDAKEERQVYFKTDTHWNEYGAYIGCKKIVEDLKEWGITDRAVAEVFFEEGEYRGEFSAMMGDQQLLGLEACPRSVIVNPNTIKVTEGEKYDAISQTLTRLNVYTPFYTYENNSIDGCKALVYGDSMFGSWNVTEVLAENFSELIYVWDGNIESEMIDLVEPDVILYEVTERYLNQLPTRSLQFIREQ